jgi:hypothetical protein
MTDYLLPFLTGALFALAIVELATTAVLYRLFPRHVGGKVLKSGIWTAYKLLKRLVNCHQLLARLNFAANAFEIRPSHTNQTQAFVELVRAATGGGKANAPFPSALIVFTENSSNEGRKPAPERIA